MPNKLIKDLIDKGAVTLKEQGYSIRSREYTLLTWKQFQEFCNKKGYETYLPSHKDEFITELGKCTPPLRQSTIDRKAGSMKMLDLLATKGTWGKGMLNPLQELLPEFNSFLDAQEEYLIKTGYSECTRETMRNYISVVMRYFQNAGITKLEELNSSHVSAYLLTLRGHAKSTVRCELSRLRKFLSYLYLLGYTSENLAPHVPEYRLGQAQSIIKIWESEEINAVLETVNRASPKGKRDYAFITIAAELGVRSKDICNLKLSDIDWELCSISFVQSKTGKPNTLPLSEKVGSAIIDYLHIRPQTKCEYLFVSLNPPYGKMKSIHSAFHRYVARSGVKVPIHAHHGLHSLRATVATKLLSADVSPDIIFSFLGHSDRESLGHYIRLDKGRKTRVVPILPATAQNLKKYLTEMHMLAPEKSHLPLFMNRNGQKLTRAGVTYILNKYAKAASVIDPSIPEKIPPHLMRHTKAMHIYDADNDLVHVRDFLGHSDIKTTDIYARSSLTMKQKALERVSDSPVPSMPSWQKSRSTMEWLKSFGSQKA